MPDRNKNIFVTGGTGFVGSHLLRHLVDEGYRHIYATRRKESPMTLVDDIAGKINWLEGDILDVPFLEEAMGGMNYIFHCAGVVSFDTRDAKRLMAVNGTGTANVVNIALDVGVDKMIHVSSIAALGRSKTTKTVDENTAWVRSNYNTDYAISKYFGEMEVWRGIEEGLTAAIVNPAIILGHEILGRGTSKMLLHVKRGSKFYPPGGSGFVGVKDVVRFMVLLMDSDIVGERFLLSAEDLTYKTVFEMIAAALGQKPPVIQVNRLMTEIAWRVEWLRARLTGKSALITKQTARHSGRTFHYENAKSKSVFGFEYTPVQEVIGEMVKDFGFLDGT